MPTINIKEVDSTGISTAATNDYVVLVPGKATAVAGYNLITGGTADTIITALEYEALSTSRKALYESVALTRADKYTALFSDADAFKANMGYDESDAESGEVINSNTGYLIALRLLALGMVVQYVVYNTDSELDSDTFWTPFEDRGMYDLRFITSGGISTKATADNMLKCAATRGDAIALIDAPATTTAVADVDAWMQALANTAIIRSDGVKEDIRKYGAGFAPWFKPVDSDIYLPPSVGYLSCFATHISRFPAWFATSGSTRGVFPFVIDALKAQYGDAAVGTLQARTLASGSTTHAACNVISNIRPYGEILWGNRTLHSLGIQVDGSDEETDLTASSFLNIRQLCCSLKKTLYRTSRRYTFEPNGDVLWANFTGSITPLLDEMRSGQGIRGYRIKKDTTTQKGVLKAHIQIIPIEAVEDFDLTVELTDSIITVTE